MSRYERDAEQREGARVPGVRGREEPRACGSEPSSVALAPRAVARALEPAGAGGRRGAAHAFCSGCRGVAPAGCAFVAFVDREVYALL